MILKQIRLGLIHVAIAMTLVPINSTLNRVMIKELAISATLVAFLASLPYLFSPIQVAIGSYSDRHPMLGLRRTPYILLGLVLCVSGVIVAPYAAFVFAENRGLGVFLAALAFGAWGMGYNLASVSYLSLASEISGESGRGKTIAIMWFMMIASIIVTAIGLSHLVDPYTPDALLRAFRLVGLAAFIIGLLGIAGLEKSSIGAQHKTVEEYSWTRVFSSIVQNRQAITFFWYLIILLAAILGQDILLEPFGAEAFGMTVKETTRITSVWGVCVLVALLVAGLLEGRVSKRRIAVWGAVGALLGFILIVISGLFASLGIFFSGVVLLGFGTGLSTVSNLSLMLDMTTTESVGLFIGAWGMANAISRLVGTILGGAIRDIVSQVLQDPLVGYLVVFGIEAVMLVVSLAMLRQINVAEFQQGANQTPIMERTALAGEI